MPGWASVAERARAVSDQAAIRLSSGALFWKVSSGPPVISSSVPPGGSTDSRAGWIPRAAGPHPRSAPCRRRGASNPRCWRRFPGCPSERVHLSAVEEEAGVVLEFVGVDEHAIPVRAEQRLVRQAGAAGVWTGCRSGRHCWCRTSTGSTSGRIAGLAHRDQHVGAVEGGGALKLPGASTSRTVWMKRWPTGSQ